MKYNSSFDAYEQTGSSKAYFDQFKTANPKLGGKYKVVGCGLITKTVEIVAIVDKVAIGKVIADTNGGCFVGELSMYNIEGYAIGWKYKEHRSGYRLQDL